VNPHMVSSAIAIGNINIWWPQIECCPIYFSETQPVYMVLHGYSKCHSHSNKNSWKLYTSSTVHFLLMCVTDHHVCFLIFTVYITAYHISYLYSSYVCVFWNLHSQDCARVMHSLIPWPQNMMSTAC